MKQIAPTLQTLYADLVQQVHAGTVKPGSVYVQRDKGSKYLYAKRRIGTTRINQYIGPAQDPDAIRRAEQIRAEQGLAKQRRSIVSMLRRGGVPTPTRALGQVLDAVSDAGLFREVVLVGTGAYQCYSPVIGVVLPAALLTTQDADFATASLAVAADREGETLLEILQRADKTFEPIPGLDRNAPPASFRSAAGFVVDLLTPNLRRSDPNPMPLEKLRAGAVPLQHLGWLIQDPVAAVALFGAGIPVSVPQPARYAVLKLILAQKRSSHDRLKRAKDLAQAQALIEALETADPFALRDALEDAYAQGRSGWRQPAERSLRELKIVIDQIG